MTQAKVNGSSSSYSDGHGKFFEDAGVWKKAPLLKGSTKFEPLPEVKNIMITGGAGFMYVEIPQSSTFPAFCDAESCRILTRLSARAGL